MGLGCPRAGTSRTVQSGHPGVLQEGAVRVPLRPLLLVSHPGPEPVSPHPAAGYLLEGCLPTHSHHSFSLPLPLANDPAGVPVTGLWARAPPAAGLHLRSPPHRPVLTCSVPGPPSSTTQTMGILMATPRTKHEPRIRDAGAQTLPLGPSCPPPASSGGIDGDGQLVWSGFQRLTLGRQWMICLLYVMRANSSPEMARPPSTSVPFLGVQAKAGLSASEATPTSLLSSACLSWSLKSAHAKRVGFRHHTHGRGAQRRDLHPLSRRSALALSPPHPSRQPGHLQRLQKSLRGNKRPPTCRLGVSGPTPPPRLSGTQRGSHAVPGPAASASPEHGEG